MHIGLNKWILWKCITYPFVTEFVANYYFSTHFVSDVISVDK